MIYERPAPPASRTDFVLETIKAGILSGELRPGQALVEAELAAGLEVSKTPVREALKTLAGSGLVVMSPYKGASVRIVDAELARAVYEVRAVMEPEAVRRAAELGADFGAAAVALGEAAREGDPAKISLINRRFHRMLYAGCGNSLMAGILGDLSDPTALINVAGWGNRPALEPEDREHAEILAAATAGDAGRAAELLRTHIQTFAKRVVRELPDGA